MAKTLTIPTGVKYKDKDKDGAWSKGDEIIDSGVRGYQYFGVNGKFVKLMAGKQETIEDDDLADAVAKMAGVTAAAAPAAGGGGGGGGQA